MSKSIKTQFMFPAELYKALLAESQRTGASMAWIVRQALAAYLERKQ